VQHAGSQRRRRQRRQDPRRVSALTDHEGVPLGRLLWVGDADDLAELDGHADRVLDVGTSLGPVGVQQLLAGDAAQDQVQLPGQVGGVANAGAHALPGEGGHQVGGVAGQQQPRPI
jgi:hypothetical protein